LEQTSFADADALFLQELQGVRDILTNDAEVTSIIGAIKHINNKIEQLKQAKRDHANFYSQRIQANEDTIAFLQARIERYLETKGESSIPTPLGTAFFVERDKVQWPDDDTLLEYAKTHNIEYKVQEKPLKTPITEYIQNGGEPPEGYSVRPERSLSIRTS